VHSPNRARDVCAQRPNPNAKWVCGYERVGLACSQGPDERGACCQVRQSQPVQRVDQQTCHENCSCTQHCELAQLRRVPELPSHADLGPCIPRRAGWYWRQTLMLNMAILVAGGLLLCMTLPQREAFFAPGGLSQKHAQLLDNHLVSDRCSLCHPNSHATAGSAQVQDELCLRCHVQHLPNASLRSPHDLSAAQLVKLTSKWHKPDSKPTVGAIPQTSCAICHIEHHGSGFDLTHMSDASCQACHQRQFESLAAGHPQFESYPYRSTRQVAFDHHAHQTKHFGTKNEPFDCARCHVDQQQTGGLGSVFRSVGFEQACASCHREAIRSATISGWALLQLPSIEAAAASDPSLGLQDWPTAAQFGYEGEISIAVRLLLAADPELQPWLMQLPANGQLQGTSHDPQVRAAVAQNIARGLRRLIADIANQGQAAWQRRLIAAAEDLLARKLTAHELKLTLEMSQGLPPDLFRQMELRWFNSSNGLVSKPSLPAQSVSFGQDLLDDSALSTDSGDTLLLDGDGLLENQAGSSEELLAPRASPASNGQPDANTAPRFTKLRGADHVAAGGWYLDQELLALSYMPRGHADPTLAAWSEFVAILDWHLNTANDEANLSEPHATAADSPQVLTPGKITQGVVVPGNCTECHLLSAPIDGLSPTSRWTSAVRSTSIRPFTKFDHGPHLALPALQDCNYCHQVQAARPHSLQQLYQIIANDPSFNSTSSSLTSTICEYLANEFIDMRVDQCAACHHAGGANAACTQCHNYHVGASGTAWSGE
jgi:hypothetical protein